MRTSAPILSIFLLASIGGPAVTASTPAHAEPTVRAPATEPSWRFDTGG